MALTVGEANAVNTVIHHLVGDRDYSGHPITRQQAIAALNLLIKGAYKTLLAGYTPEDTGRFSAREALTTRWGAAPSQVWMLELHGREAEPYVSEQAAKHEAVTHGGWDADADLAWRPDGIVPLTVGEAPVTTLYVNGQRTLCCIWPATVHGSVMDKADER